MSSSFPVLSPQQASEFARLGLANVSREYPHLLQHALNAPEDARTPRQLHPAFYGSYDWHSCVHQHCMLARLARLFPDLPERAEIDRVLAAHLSAENIAAETAYFTAPGRSFFERPYGWAWLLKLAEELQRHDATLARNLAPLVAVVRAGLLAYLPALTHPVRHGVHNNTAFAVKLALDYARAADDQELKLFCTSRMAYWFGHDTDYGARWEPSGEDFLSPALTEAEVMAAVLPPDNFSRWLSRFLPNLHTGEPVKLFTPVRVSNPSDPKIAHLIGLNLNRAWCWRRISLALAESDPRQTRAREAAVRHLEAALPMIDVSDFNRAHWLASFAVYALTES
ncbi:hypothetical protein Verru16b_01030 [Lacunisphaera limnophila]|uniref:DUF2891 domain-containing protein n=1 Tax=Lacunisphaera limnophila TaxID=1838286 RepID=A0A1D8ASY4_9BACT|nr:DUF2891 domain-containing protein [Lacunisphaera limnophila]AOS43970.1 hypothetical protein Verru16b_01030 [Lacunisphaera limnophila]